MVTLTFNALPEDVVKQWGALVGGIVILPLHVGQSDCIVPHPLS